VSVDLRSTAVLEIDGFDDRTGVFHLKDDFSDREEINREYVVSEAGQYLRYGADIVSDFTPDDIADTDFDAREGYHIDGGAGSQTWTLSFQHSVDDPSLQWGDGSSNPDDPEDYSKYDATGCHPLVAKQIFGNWLRLNSTDSRASARLHWGEYSDGTHGGDGLFDPVPVTIDNATLAKDESDPSVFEGTLELTRTAEIPGLEDALDDIQDAIDDLVSDIGEVVTDW